MSDHLKLLCFPYAGASAAVFRKLRRFLPARIELEPVELAGHGVRMKEPLIDSIEGQVQDLLPRVVDVLRTPTAVFCHSVGTLIAFELLHRARAEFGVEPTHVIFSGRHTPDVPSKTSWHEVSDPVFLSMIRGIGGTSQEVLDTPELVSLFTPILKADYKMAETYVYAAPPDTLNCPVTAVAGTRDPIVSGEQLARWAEFTSGPFAAHQLVGGHFYWLDDAAPLCSIITRALAGPSTQPYPASDPQEQVAQP